MKLLFEITCLVHGLITMKVRFTTSLLRPEAVLRMVVLLIYCLTPPLHPSLAATEEETNFATVPVISSGKQPSTDTPFDEANKSYRLGLLLNYVRQEVPGLMPGLPSVFRAPLGMALGENTGSAAAGSLLPEFLSPVAALMEAPGPGEDGGIWLTPGYHHVSGMMPFDDALTMGFNYRYGFLGDRVKFNIHPFYGQNWVSPQGFWGTEMTLGLGPDAEHSWGKISMRYDNGTPDLMGDNERGYEMGGELAFTDKLSLAAGVREDNQTDLGDYALLRWKLKF
jgi:hypothetical protein